MDWQRYLQDLADSRLRIARLADDEHRAIASELALAEIKGAGEALAAAGLLTNDVVSAYVVRLGRAVGAELVEQGLAEAVTVEVSNTTRVDVAPKESPTPR